MTDEYSFEDCLADWFIDQGLEEAVFLNDLDDAIIGAARCKGRENVVAYDYDKVVKIIRKQCGNCSEDEAVEYVEYNITDAYFGKMTPVFIHKASGKYGL